MDSPPDPSQGWPGRQGPARVRVDTALRPQDPAVLIMPGPTVPARDPVVDLRACAIPPHFVQPWATIEVVRDSGSAGEDEGVVGEADEERPSASAVLSAEAEDIASMVPLRPESALELLRGCAVRTDGVVHLLTTATDAVCRGVRLLCRRSPGFVIPPLPVPAPEISAPSNRGSGGGGHRSSKKQPGCGRPRDTGWRTEGEGRGAGEQRPTGVETRDGAAGPGPASEGGEKGKERDTRVGAVVRGGGGGGGTGVRHVQHGIAAAAAATTATVGRSGRGTPGGKKGGSRAGEEGDWARRLSEWGVVTTGSEVVVPHRALEVWYRDARRPASSSSSSRGEPAWVEAVLRSHEPSVVDDLSAGLGLDLVAPRCPSAADRGFDAEEAGKEDGRRAAGAGAGAASARSGGALLVHGPPGVGKTRLVR